jgi:polysaccharide pyruvyl transferase WcaK-like protein
VLYLADYRAYRDERSKHLIETIGVSRPGPVFPDVVYSLPVTGAVRQMGAADDSRVIGVNVFPRQDPRYVSDGDPEAYRAYLGTLGAFVAWLLRAGYIVLLFPTQLRADTLVMEDLKKTIRDDVQGLEHRLVEPRIETVEDLVSHVATTALVVATRFHGILISFLLGKPVLALSDQPKMDDLVEDMGLSDYLLSLDRFDVESMIERFKSLEANREILTARIQRRAREHRRALEGQFDSLLENGIGGR